MVAIGGRRFRGCPSGRSAGGGAGVESDRLHTILNDEPDVVVDLPDPVAGRTDEVGDLAHERFTNDRLMITVHPGDP